jgi:hypothetical protein
MSIDRREIGAGDLVIINTSVCFTKSQGGNRDFPLYSYEADDAGYVPGYVKLEKEEKEKYDKVMGISPDVKTFKAKKNTAFRVIIPICKLRPRSSNIYIKLLDFESGEIFYVKKNEVTLVEP